MSCLDDHSDPTLASHYTPAPFQSIHKPKWSIINTDQDTVSSPTHYVPLFHSVHQTPNTLAFWLREHAMFFYYLSWIPRMVCSTSCFRSQFNCHFPSEAFHDQHQSFLIFCITKFFFIAFFSSCNCLIYLLFFGFFFANCLSCLLDCKLPESRDQVTLVHYWIPNTLQRTLYIIGAQ